MTDWIRVYLHTYEVVSTNITLKTRLVQSSVVALSGATLYISNNHVHGSKQNRRLAQLPQRYQTTL